MEEIKSQLKDLQNEMKGIPDTVRKGMKEEFLDAINSLRKKAPEPQKDESQTPGKECVEALMTKTGFIPENTRNKERMFILYERLYSRGVLISSVMEYLRFRGDVKVMVDFSSDGIGNLKSKIKDLDGRDKDGDSLMAHADLGEKVVYIAALNTSESWLLPQLAQKLSLLAIGMLFQNGGRPHVKGDATSQSRFDAILKQAETNKEELDLTITNAMGMKEQSARAAYLISVVPWLCAEYSVTIASEKLRNQLPTLLEYYKDHVVPKLLKESKEEIRL